MIMPTHQSKVFSGPRVTIPKPVREALGVRTGTMLTWHVDNGRVFVDVHKKITDPVKILTSQSRTGVDIMKLLREFRDEMV